MTYILVFLPPVIAIILFIIALKNGFHKPAFIVTLGLTMVITMFTMRYLTWYGVLCVGLISLALIYIVICLVLSILEHRNSNNEE